MFPYVPAAAVQAVTPTTLIIVRRHAVHDVRQLHRLPPSRADRRVWRVRVLHLVIAGCRVCCRTIQHAQLHTTSTRSRPADYGRPH